LDDTRPITMALQYVPHRQEALHESGLAGEVDLISTNYQEGSYPDDRRQQPKKLLLGSETKPFFTTDRGGKKAQFVPRNPWRDVVEQDYVIGGLLWTIIDYFGEASWPRNGWCTSIVDTSGRPKPRSNYFQCAWSDTPQVRLQVRDTSLSITPGKLSWDAPKIACHWNWPDKVDDLVHVEAPTNCQQVELFLNGQTCGVRDVAEATNNTPEWYVPYEAGTLEAVGRNDGKDVARWTLETTGPAQQLRLTTDRRSLRGDGHDAAHVVIEVVDDEGRLVADHDLYVNVNVAGAGELLGMDNGDQISKEPYYTPRRRTWRGQCLAVVRARRGEGGITIRVTSEEFDAVETHLDVQAP
jgi:beta-galactosidase